MALKVLYCSALVLFLLLILFAHDPYATENKMEIRKSFSHMYGPVHPDSAPTAPCT